MKQRRFKIVTLALTFLFVSGGLVAAVSPNETISLETATTVAQNHIESMRSVWTQIPQLEGQPVSVDTTLVLNDPESQNLLGYVIELEPQGFIVVSNNSAISPIIAYSYRSDFPWEDDPNNILLHMVRTDLSLRKQATPQVSPSYISLNTTLWNRYLSSQIKDEGWQSWPEVGTTPTGGWVETVWRQGEDLFDNYYNDACPDDPETEPGIRYSEMLESGVGTSDGRCVTGCVATAMGQIVNYWQYPSSVEFPNESYTSRCNPGDEYGLRKITIFKPDGDIAYVNYNNGKPSNQTIADLLFSCGVSVEMGYSDVVSGAYTSDVDDALEDLFGYLSARWVANNIFHPWFYDSLEQNMKSAQPVQLSISKPGVGHSIVCDGFRQAPDVDDEYHLNYGWGTYSPDAIVTAWYVLPDSLPADYTTVEGGVISILAPFLHPDNLISLSPYSGYIGDNIYNLTGSGQTKIVNIDFNMTQRYYVRIQNDGNVPQAIYVHAGGDFGGDWEAHFYNQQTGDEITQQIIQTPGWSTGEMDPEEERLIRLEVTSPDKGEIGDWLTIGVESTSSLDNIKQDMVIARTQIVGSGSPLIKVTQPNGGESWMANTHRRIYWEADATISNVKIELSRNSGAGWDEIITSSTPNDGEYRWLITEPSSNNCRVKVSEVGDPAVFDVSDNDFIIRSDDDFPHPDFEADDTLVVINEQVTFTNLSTNGPFKRFEWAFGDGSHEVTYNVDTKVTHRFDYDDEFTITLDAYKYVGGPDTLLETKQREDYIHVLKYAPHITASPSSFHVTLAPDESEDHNLTIGNTGDGTLNWNLDESPSVVWLREDPLNGSVAVSGQQSVTLTFDAGGFVDTTMITWLLIHSNDPEESRNPLKVSCTLTVTPPPEPPVADFSGSPRSGEPPLPVSFTDQSTGLIDTWFWDFGDGNSSGDKNPTHTYQNVGSYDVALTVTGPGGSDTETKEDYITVGSPPVADFTADDTSGCAPLEVQFTDESSGDVTSWDWTFGDTESSNKQNPTHTYSNPGQYTVSLLVEGPAGSDRETKTDYITVGSEPEAAFSADSVEGCPPLEVSFTDESSGYPDNWQWDFGDGGSSTESDPDHIYEEPGTYTVSLSVSNACGDDIETKENYVTVWAPDIAVNPTTLNSELETGEYETTEFIISNDGNCLLTFSIEESQTSLETPKTSPGETGPVISPKGSQSMPAPKGTDAGAVSPSAQVQAAPAGLNGEVKPQTPIEQRILLADVDWISVWPSQGEVEPGSYATIEVTFDAVSLDCGTYVAYLVITSNDPDENPLAVVCSLKVNETPGGIEEGISSIPMEFSFAPITPNILSSGSGAKISYALPKATRVNITIFDINGRRVKTLVNGEMPAGYHQLGWDTRDDQGRAVSSGSYFCRMQASDFVASKKVVITGGFSVRGDEEEEEDTEEPEGVEQPTDGIDDDKEGDPNGG